MYYGIAFCGEKAAGKDMLTDYLTRTRENTQIFRCKTPVVEAYEAATQTSYVKGQNDLALMNFSKTYRRNNENAVGIWMMDRIPHAMLEGITPIVPDVRRVPDAKYLSRLGMMMIKIEVDESVRIERIIRREGSLSNYDPDDITETDVERIHCPYLIDNTKDDGGRFACQQLESYLSRQGSLFKPRPDLVPYIEKHGMYSEGDALV